MCSLVAVITVAERMADSELVLVDGSGHMLCLETPKVF